VRVTLMQDGRIIAEARTNAEGEFQMPGVSPGEYTISARGAGGTAARSIRIAPFDQAVPNQPLDTFSLELTPLTDSSATPGAGAPLVAPRTSSAGGGSSGGSGGTSGGSGGVSLSPGGTGGGLGGAAGLAGVGALSGLAGGSGSGSGGGSGTSNAPTENASDFEP
jgi:hypothetical protein